MARGRNPHRARRLGEPRFGYDVASASRAFSARHCSFSRHRLGRCRAPRLGTRARLDTPGSVIDGTNPRRGLEVAQSLQKRRRSDGPGSRAVRHPSATGRSGRAETPANEQRTRPVSGPAAPQLEGGTCGSSRAGDGRRNGRAARLLERAEPLEAGDPPAQIRRGASPGPERRHPIATPATSDPSYSSGAPCGRRTTAEAQQSFGTRSHPIRLWGDWGAIACVPTEAAILRGPSTPVTPLPPGPSPRGGAAVGRLQEGRARSASFPAGEGRPLDAIRDPIRWRLDPMRGGQSAKRSRGRSRGLPSRARRPGFHSRPGHGRKDDTRACASAISKHTGSNARRPDRPPPAAEVPRRDAEARPNRTARRCPVLRLAGFSLSPRGTRRLREPAAARRPVRFTEVRVHLGGVGVPSRPTPCPPPTGAPATSVTFAPSPPTSDPPARRQQGRAFPSTGAKSRLRHRA